MILHIPFCSNVFERHSLTVMKKTPSFSQYAYRGEQNGPYMVEPVSMNDRCDNPEKSNIDALQDVMKRLTLAVKVAETVMSESSLDYVPNALLNITISRMIATEGKANTAILLSKLSEMIMEGVDPENRGPVRIS